MSDRLVLANGQVFDGTGSTPFAADVAIADGKIAEVGHNLAGDHVVDISGKTVMPGFIDCHVHVAYTSPPSTYDPDVTPSYFALGAARTLSRLLAIGITTVRDAGGADAGYRQAIDDGLVDGPRLQVSLMQLSPSAGPYDARSRSGVDTWIAAPGIPRPVADSPDGLRAKVREYVQAGADVIKIFATGPYRMPRAGAHRSMFTDAELAAIVDEAGRHGLKVMAHAHGSRGAVAAARAGVASIEHGIFLDDAAIDAMVEAGTVLVPTLLASADLTDDADSSGGSERAGSVAARHREVVRRAHERGVPIAFGTDAPVTPHGRNLEELELLVECGLTPFEALRSATSSAAQLLGLEHVIGSIAPGQRADIVVVESDPSVVVGLAGRVHAVYKHGLPVSRSDVPPKA